MMIIEVMLDSHSWVELEGRNARLYYMLHGVTHKSYDGLIRGLPESVIMELEELGAIKSKEDIKRKIIEAKRALASPELVKALTAACGASTEIEAKRAI